MCTETTKQSFFGIFKMVMLQANLINVTLDFENKNTELILNPPVEKKMLIIKSIFNYFYIIKYKI